MITMTKIQPINPNEIISEKVKIIPDQVIRVFQRTDCKKLEQRQINSVY